MVGLLLRTIRLLYLGDYSAVELVIIVTVIWKIKGDYKKYKYIHINIFIYMYVKFIYIYIYIYIYICILHMYVYIYLL